MIVKPAISKLNLTAHITFSAGWIGAVAGFLGLAIAGLMGQDPGFVRSMYIGMEVITWFVVVPFCISSLVTGVVQSLISHWGLFRHYWIVIKLILTLVATVGLLLHIQPIEQIVSIAKQGSVDGSQVQGLRVRLIADASVAIFILLAAMALSVYKPFGRIQFTITSPATALREQSLGFYVILALIMLFIAIVVLHLFGVNLGHHLVR